MDRVKFRRFIPPSTPVSLEVSLHELREESARVKVRALVDGKWRARAEQVFVFNAVAFENPEEVRRVEAVERAELARLWPGHRRDPSGPGGWGPVSQSRLLPHQTGQAAAWCSSATGRLRATPKTPKGG